MESLKDLTDAQLADLLQQRDEIAFAELYSRYWLLLYRHALRMLNGDEKEAEDILQDTFAALWDQATELDIPGQRLSGFLYGMLRNKVLNRLAYNSVRQEHLQSLGRYEEAGEAMADQALRDKELARIIEQEVGRLPGKMQEVFDLRFRQERSYREIADGLGVTEHTVRKQLSNARQILRERLKGYGLGFFSALWQKKEKKSYTFSLLSLLTYKWSKERNHTMHVAERC